MSVKLLTEHHLEFLSLKGGCSLNLSKYHIVGNHMSQLNYYASLDSCLLKIKLAIHLQLETFLLVDTELFIFTGKFNYYTIRNKIVLISLYC